VILGGAGWSLPAARERLGEVVADAGATCQGWFDIVAVTDHTSAFVDALPSLSPEQLWLPWTEDPNDPVARGLASEREAAVASLRRSANRLQIHGDQRRAQSIATVLASLSPIDGKVLDAFRDQGTQVRYCRPSDPPLELYEQAARMQVLGPPLDLEDGGLAESQGKGIGAAVDVIRNNLSPALESTQPDAPFGALYAIPLQISQEMPFFRQHYWTTQTWRRIDAAWLERSPELAELLDQGATNLSLSLAIELSDHDVLLFAPPAKADAGLLERAIFRTDKPIEPERDSGFVDLTF
jgi:hypothetical protein